jgi:hypothetical protein
MIDKVDIYRADYNGLEPSQRHTQPYYFDVLENFLSASGGEESAKETATEGSREADLPSATATEGSREADLPSAREVDLPSATVILPNFARQTDDAFGQVAADLPLQPTPGLPCPCSDPSLCQPLSPQPAFREEASHLFSLPAS